MVAHAYYQMNIDVLRADDVPVMATKDYPALIYFSVADQYDPASLVMSEIIIIMQFEAKKTQEKYVTSISIVN